MEVNYITQLTEVLSRFSDDNRLNPTHVSLYLALFQFWNLNRFHNPVSISRSEVMKVSKIGSNATYHRCIKDLHKWKYLEYLPSYNPLKGSLVNMFKFETSNKQALNGNHFKNEQVLEQVLVPSINSINNTNNYKQDRGKLHSPRKTQKRFSPPSLNEIIEFFKEKKETTQEAEKFFNHFESNGWKVGGKTPMKNWQAAAKNWILRSANFNNSSKNNLHVNENKDYDIPL